MALMLLMAMAMGMKNDFAMIIFLLLLRVLLLLLLMMMMMMMMMMNNNQNDDHSGIDDDGNLITHDCVNGDFGECDDHRHTSMCQCVKLLRLYATCLILLNRILVLIGFV